MRGKIYAALAILAALLLGVLIGRAARPERIITKTETHTVKDTEAEARVQALLAEIAVLKQRVKIVRVVERSPDGATKSTTTTDRETDAVIARAGDVRGEQKNETHEYADVKAVRIETRRPDWFAGPAVLFVPQTHTFYAGPTVGRRLFGSIYLGGTAYLPTNAPLSLPSISASLVGAW